MSIYQQGAAVPDPLTIALDENDIKNPHTALLPIMQSTLSQFMGVNYWFSATQGQVESRCSSVNSSYIAAS
ncbi:hypothetical protein WG68_07975 [Arsukibacterium ikkense]|uniref:Uncharacterized protein n=1 Tax=Arsukibacterium ikkense TaxID=336831 RepID=A0A0M2V8E5_9GAMM|nr:hypothetical protein WG68_07975 [Arsukibacterium ikkense]